MLRIKSTLFMVVAGLTCFVALTMLSTPGLCQGAPAKSRTVYVPVYSMVYTGDRAIPVNLASTLSIRNTDPRKSIRIFSADYYSSAGQLVRRMLPKALVLGPLSSTNIFIKEKDTSGGFGTSFLVSWGGDANVSTPIIQCLNIGAYSGLGISFVTPGQEVH
ncbi:MAG: DUF3124 domain-containing protein [Deltaproteobacteria bacterium]|nr:DUF3124 domain-containing protein [Deltaproteobacteria bacterium]